MREGGVAGREGEILDSNISKTNRIDRLSQRVILLSVVSIVEERRNSAAQVTHRLCQLRGGRGQTLLLLSRTHSANSEEAEATLCCPTGLPALLDALISPCSPLTQECYNVERSISADVPW